MIKMVIYEQIMTIFKLYKKKKKNERITQDCTTKWNRIVQRWTKCLPFGGHVYPKRIRRARVWNVPITGVLSCKKQIIKTIKNCF